MKRMIVGLAMLAMSLFGCTPAQQGGAPGADAGQPKAPVTALKAFKGHGDMHMKAVVDGTLLIVDFKSNGLTGDGYVGSLTAKIEAGQHMLVVACKVSTGENTDLNCSLGYDFSTTRDPSMDTEGTKLLEIAGEGQATLDLIAQDLPIKVAFDLDAATGEEVEFTGKGLKGEVLVSVQSFGARCQADTRTDPDRFSCAPIISFGMPTAAVPSANPSADGQ